MLVLSPQSRFSADDCYDLVVRLPRAKTDSLHTWAPASFPEEENQTTLRYIVQNDDDIEDPATVVYQPRSHTGTTAPSYLVRSGAPAPSSRMTQQHGETEVPSSSAIRRYNNGQKGHEMAHFLEDYSANPFNPLYVGSSLASQLGGNSSEDWASQFLQESAQRSQAGVVGSETGRGSGPPESSIPQAGNGGWHVASGTGSVEGGNAIGADGYEEMAQAALMLQAIGQDFRAS
ncbi:hypothetical protein QQZ08_003775 [Neonectria magnoliae]|uniref:Uncharacterized protein n=1 Tax=Neonectria magnoliae TaxID=2732573 RepID=A0ABR1I942_9HYPO